MQVTVSQVLAFLDTLLGWEDDECRRPKSPYVKTHLEAILGLYGVPDLYDIRKLMEWPKREEIFFFERDSFTRLSQVVEYLKAVTEAIDKILSDTESKFETRSSSSGDWGENDDSQG